MQYNLVNDQEQVSQFVWRGVALRGVSVYQYIFFFFFFFGGGGGVPAAFFSVCVCYLWGFSVASSGSSSGQRFFCILCMRLRMSSWFCLAQRSVCWRSGAFKCFPALLSLLRGVRALPL